MLVILRGIPDLFGWRTSLSEWLGILSMFFSAYSAFMIAKIRAQMIGRVKLPSLIAKLRKVTKELSELMSNYSENTELIGLALARSESSLKTLLKTIKGQPKTTAQKLLKDIQLYRGSRKLNWPGSTPNKTKQNAWKIYETMNVLTEELKDTVEEQRIGGQS